jgi:hypothetical protein
MRVFWFAILSTIIFSVAIVTVSEAQVHKYGARPSVKKRDPSTREMALAIRALENKVRRLERRVRTLER